MDHNLNNSVKPDEENFPGGLDEDGQEALVHFSKEEAEVYDVIQGGMHLDKETEIRSYKPFGELLKNKDFQELVVAILSEEKAGLENAPELHQAMQVGEQMVKSEGKPFEPAPGDSNPVIMELAEKGKGSGAGKDTVMVMMPANVLFLTGLIKGEVPINAATGYPMFFFKKLMNSIGNVGRSVVRVGATIAGAVMGGPLGAMAGSAAGSALTGRRPGDWLGVAGKSGLYTAGAQLAMPHIPGLAGAGGVLAGSGVPGMGAMGNYMSRGAAAPNMSASLGLGSLMGGQSAAAGAAGAAGSTAGAAGAAGAAGGAEAPSFLGGLAANPLMQMAPLALTMGAGVLANKGAKEQYGHQMQERERQMREDKAREAELKREAGWDEGFKETQKRTVNPRWQEPGEPYFLYEGDDAYTHATDHHRYAKGGAVIKKKTVPLRKGLLIKGHGRGQDDLIHTNSDEGAFIIDASTVSALGDGSTDAGAERMSEYLDNTKHKLMPPGERNYAALQAKKTGKTKIPVALSRDEIYLTPADVSVCGFGDHKDGIRNLNQFVKQIREHKSSNGNKLPPKAKSIEEYMRG